MEKLDCFSTRIWHGQKLEFVKDLNKVSNKYIKEAKQFDKNKKYRKKYGEFGISYHSKNLVKEDQLLEFLIENNSEDYEINETEYSIYCDQNHLHELNDKLIKQYGQTNSANLIWKSKNNINIGKETADKLFKLLEVLEDNDDVQVVSSNFEVNDNILSSLTA